MSGNNMREIAVVVSNDNKDVSVIETINAIEKAGFKNVFIQWYNKDWNPTQEEQLKYIKNDIRICKENDISMVVMHLTSKSVAPKYNETGLKRLQEIVDYAESLNVKVAFENTKIKGYLDYVIENIDNANVGICFDSGHYHVHFDDDLDFSKFKNRIFAVHLHDNDKSDALHLIPFDGTLNWESVVKNLKDSNYNGPITMELCYRYEYLEMGIENFYKKGYEVGEKLKEMFERA